MRIRSDIISKTISADIDYDLNIPDKYFYFFMPEIRFREDNTYFLIDDLSSDNEE